MAPKDITGHRYDRLVAVRFVERRSGHRYWEFQCDCGEFVLRTIYIQTNKYNACPKCLTGGGSWAWAGVGEFPQSHYKRIQHSAIAKNFAMNVSPEYLWELFLSQGRKCAFTGWEIVFTSTYADLASRTASLDRIDSSKGYIEGNLQWVHRDVNKLKKNMSDERFIELCIAVSNKQEQRQ